MLAMDLFDDLNRSRCDDDIGMMVQTGASEPQSNVEQLMLCIYLVYLLINRAKPPCLHCRDACRLSDRRNSNIIWCPRSLIIKLSSARDFDPL